MKTLCIKDLEELNKAFSNPKIELDAIFADRDTCLNENSKCIEIKPLVAFYSLSKGFKRINFFYYRRKGGNDSIFFSDVDSLDKVFYGDKKSLEENDSYKVTLNELVKGYVSAVRANLALELGNRILSLTEPTFKCNYVYSFYKENNEIDGDNASVNLVILVPILSHNYTELFKSIDIKSNDIECIGDLCVYLPYDEYFLYDKVNSLIDEISEAYSFSEEDCSRMKEICYAISMGVFNDDEFLTNIFNVYQENGLKARAKFNSVNAIDKQNNKERIKIEKLKETLRKEFKKYVSSNVKLKAYKRAIPVKRIKLLESFLESIGQTNNKLPHIREFREEVYFEAIDHNPYLIADVKYMSYKICKLALNKDPFSLKCISEQTPRICSLAIKNNPYAILYVKNQTEDLCLKAVKANGLTIKFVKNQTDKICLEAVKRTPEALKFVKNQTKEICLTAFKKDPNVLKYIRNVSAISGLNVKRRAVLF